jgi:hypothetical protein
MANDVSSSQSLVSPANLQETGPMGFGHPTPLLSQYNGPHQTPPLLAYDPRGFATRIYQALNYTQYRETGFADRVDRLFQAARKELYSDLDKYDRECRALMRQLAHRIVEIGLRNDQYLVDHQDLI